MLDLLNVIRENFSNPLVIKGLQTTCILIVLVMIRNMMHSAINRFLSSADLKYRWRKVSKFFVITLGVLVITPLWLKGVQTFATFLGLLTAGVAIALKDLISNIAAWIYILVYRPFKLGDRIQIKEMSGDVIDIDMFQISMLEIGNWVDSDQSTGRIIHMPTAFVFSESLFNYTKGFNWIWNEMNVLITFESNWQKTREILEKIINDYEDNNKEKLKKAMKQAKKNFLVSYDNIEPIVYLSVKDSGVNFTIRYFCEPKNRRGSEHELWNNILKEFDLNPDIEFAYPTTRFYNYSDDVVTEDVKELNRETKSKGNKKKT